MIDPFELALQLKDCLCDRLSETVLGPVCKCTLYPSNVPTADICSKTLVGNGEAKIHVNRIFNTRDFPNPLDRENCANYVAVELVITVRRCAPTMGNQGELPNEEDLELALLGILDDAHAMRCAVMCCTDAKLITVGDWTLLSLQGGCMGGQLISTIGIDQASCDLGSVGSL